MDIKEFNETIPDLEGYTISDLRIDGKGGVTGFVLKDKKEKKRYIMYFGDDFRVVDYW